MEHSNAVELGCAEKYIRRQLTAAEMDEFEQHFFSCRECAEEVRWLALFEDNARRAARQSDAAAVEVLQLLAAAEAACPLPATLHLVLMLPAGNWREAALFTGTGAGAAGFHLTAGDAPIRGVLVPSRELAAGTYRVTAKAAAGGEETFSFRLF